MNLLGGGGGGGGGDHLRMKHSQLCQFKLPCVVFTFLPYISSTACSAHSIGRHKDLNGSLARLCSVSY